MEEIARAKTLRPGDTQYAWSLCMGLGQTSRALSWTDSHLHLQLLMMQSPPTPPPPLCACCMHHRCWHLNDDMLYFWNLLLPGTREASVLRDE